MSSNSFSFFRYQFPAIFWALLIFYLSSLPHLTFPVHFWNVDKLIHLEVFFALGILTARAFIFQGWNELLKERVLLFTFLFVLLYGLSDEFHQYFVPGRSSDIFDALADTIGGTIAVLTIKFLPRKYLF